jgi:TRAP-type C4-dicarboxylate transport system permease small subunit
MASSDRYARLRQFSSRALTLFASLTLFAIMWLTVIDVIARDVLSGSIVGAFEVTEILMGILVFSGVPLVTAAEGHVAVTLFDGLIGPRLRVVQRACVNLICVVVLALLAWRLWDVAEKLAAYNDITLFLRIPLAPVGYFMAVMTAIAVPIQIALTFSAPEDAEGPGLESI